jgi:outer membrane protein OmpA-like peptidoglycan-associated protein
VSPAASDPSSVSARTAAIEQAFNEPSTSDPMSAAQRRAFIEQAFNEATNTPEAPRTPAAVERAWSAQHREGRRDQQTDSIITLYNFDVGSAAIKPEHAAFLAKFFGTESLGRLERRETGSRYIVTGRASLTGAEQGNWTIAGLRAEAVAASLSSRFGIAGTRVKTRAADPKLQLQIGADLEAGEWYAFNRQAQIQRLETDPVPPPSVRDDPDDPEDLHPGAPPPPATFGKAFTFEFAETIPPKGEFDLNGWAKLSAKVSGQAKVSPAQAKVVTYGAKFSWSDSIVPKVKAEFQAKLTDNVKVKLSIPFERSPKGPYALPIKAPEVSASFKEFGPLADVDLGVDFSKLTTPLTIAKSWSGTIALNVDGIDFVADVKGQIKIYIGLGPKSVARLGQLAQRVWSGATVTTEGAAVSMGIAAPVAVGVGGVAIFIGCTVGMAKTVEWAKEEGMRRARVIATRQGFALTVATEALGHTPEVDSYGTIVDAEYARLASLDPEVGEAYTAARADALAQLRTVKQQPKKAFLDGVKKKYGDHIEQSHDAVFKALGGLDAGDPQEKSKLFAIPVDP